ncbi:hypothetical protein DQ04_07851020 [Trypanosoma grayi]|uniref:hypothetical protein n=1 Tax=Trypanosoma grayi TaxID=71804 RepID=UPI0004F48AE1|nr:hypothetical protein DQ04_07851020 [Trypanosoma grayi]KEG08164.1 hypothetical protein DQ04_07851020 [Trypanosoma grayi]
MPVGGRVPAWDSGDGVRWVRKQERLRQAAECLDDGQTHVARIRHPASRDFIALNAAAKIEEENKERNDDDIPRNSKILQLLRMH